MDSHDRPVRFVILVLYAVAATKMVWSGAAYRLVMPELVPVLALTALLFWLFAAGQFPWPHWRFRRGLGRNGAVGSPAGSDRHGASAVSTGNTEVAKGHGGGRDAGVGSSDGGFPNGGFPVEGGEPELLRGVWLSGLLYALFALPAAAYLVDSVLR